MTQGGEVETQWLEAALSGDGMVLRGPGGEAPVLDRAGAPIRGLKPGWRPTEVVNTGHGQMLLALRHQDERQAAWVLDSQRRRLADLEGLAERPRADVIGPLTDAIAEIFEGREALIDRLDPWLRRTLLSVASPADHSKVQALPERSRQVLTLPRTGAMVSRRARLDHLATLKVLGDFVSAGLDLSLALPGLDGVQPALHARHVPLDVKGRHYAVLFMRDAADAAPYVRIIRASPKGEGQIIYFPQDRSLVHCGGLTERKGRGLLRALMRWMLTLSPETRAGLWRPAKGRALLLSGIRNFGHGLWDEMHSLDRALETAQSDLHPPLVYVIQPQSGAALYGRLEDIYPELNGRLAVVDTLTQAATLAAEGDVQTYLRTGQKALASTRARMTAMALRHGEQAGLDTAATDLRAPGGRRRPVVALGLRLTNRRPVDALGFYVRLTRALVERFGPIGVVIDGLNREKGQDRAATLIFNGAAPRSTGETELDDELAFVAAYRAACADLPVDIVSCVGMPIRDNLFWLNQIDFFVAPNGGGLAKLRWAMDKPGYVLTSRINFDYCSMVGLYADPELTEPPFTPLYMNRPDEVTDIPLDPPRGAPPVVQRIPHPENFTLDEEPVIARICDLLGEFVDIRPAT